MIMDHPLILTSDAVRSSGFFEICSSKYVEAYKKKEESSRLCIITRNYISISAFYGGPNG